MSTKSDVARPKRYYSSWTRWAPSSTASGSASDVTPAQGAFSLTCDDGPQHNADGSPRWKNCSHTQSYKIEYRPLSAFAQSGDSHIFSYAGTLGSWFTEILPGSGSLTNNAWPSLPSMPSLATTYQDHLNEIYGQVKPSMLGIENLASLFGGKSLFKTTEQALRSLIAITPKKASTFKDAAKALFGMDLAKKFSVDSTARDIESSINLFEGWRQHIKKLRERQNSGYLLYKTTKSNSVSVEQDCLWARRWTGILPNSLLPYDNLMFREQVRRSCATTCFTQAKVRYTQDTLSVVNYLQGALGLNRPLSSIWAIMPLSFLLDYVISIQTLCDELDSTLNRSNAVQEMLQVGETWSCSKILSTCDAALPPGTTGYLKREAHGTHGGCSIHIEQSSFERHPLALSSVYEGWSDVGQVTLSKAATVGEIAFQIFA